MSALKRSHHVQQAEKNKHSDETSTPATKRLKSSHSKGSSTFASILDPAAKKLQAVVTNGIQNKSASKVDESHATIAANSNGNGITAQEAIEIAEDEASSSDDDTDSEEEPDADEPHTNGVVVENANEDVEMTNGAEEEEEEDDDEVPSFADMLKARNPDIIDINTKLPDSQLLSMSKDALTRQRSGLSLSTVLQQALKTDGKEMLEKCFALRDTQAIKNTIQRLPSPLAADLLTRISERIHKRPGRAGALMLWIQWSLVSHGGYLATQPDVVRRLKSLNQVIRQRAQGLLPLVQLKGKLDLLSAQLDMRKEAAIASSRAIVPQEDAGILYVDGVDEEDWSDDESAELVKAAPNADPVVAGEDASDEDDFNPQPEGESEAEEIDEDSEQDGVLDLEAEETDDDDGEDDDDDEDEDDDDDDLSEASEAEDDDQDDVEEEESEVEVKAPRPSTLSRKR